MEGKVALRRDARRFTKYSALILALLVSLLLTGCGNGGGGAGYGSVVVGAAWPGEVGTLAYLTGGGYQVLNTPYGVSGMRVIVTGSGMSAVVKDCAATAGAPGSCILDKVPAGTNRVVTLQARTGTGVTIYEATSNPFIVLADVDNSPSPSTLTMTALDVATGQNDLFTLTKNAGSLDLFLEAPTGVSGTPTGQDPMAAGLNWPFLSAFPLSGHLNLQLGDTWNTNLDKDNNPTTDPVSDFEKSFQLFMDVTDGQTGTFNLVNYGGASFYDATVNDTFYVGTMDGVSYPASSGTVDIVLFGANRIVGTFNLVMESGTTPGSTITLQGGFDVTRECDFWLPDILGGSGSSTCPQGTAILDFPALTGTPTLGATFVFDGEVVDVTVPYTVGGGVVGVDVALMGAGGLQLASNGTTTGVSSPPVTVPITIPETNFDTGLPYPAGDYDLTVSLFKNLELLGTFPDLVLETYELASYGVDSFYGPDFGMGQLQLLNGSTSPSFKSYFEPTAIPGITITKAPPGWPGMNGSPRFVDAVGDPLPAVVSKGTDLYVEADVTALTDTADVGIAWLFAGGYSSSTSFNHTPAAGTVSAGPFTIGTNKVAGDYVATVRVYTTNKDQCSSFSLPFTGSGTDYFLILYERVPPSLSCLSNAQFEASGRLRTTITVEGPPPVVGRTDPNSGAPSVPTDQVITVWFDADMDPSTITGSSFKVERTSDSATVTGTVAYQAGARSATFTPSSALAASTQYTVTLETSIITDARVPANDLYGSPTAMTWNFTTAP